MSCLASWAWVGSKVNQVVRPPKRKRMHSQAKSQATFCQEGKLPGKHMCRSLHQDPCIPWQPQQPLLLHWVHRTRGLFWKHFPQSWHNSSPWAHQGLKAWEQCHELPSNHPVGVVILADAHLCSTLTLHVYCLLRHVSTCVYVAYSYTSAWTHPTKNQNKTCSP